MINLLVYNFERMESKIKNNPMNTWHEIITHQSPRHSSLDQLYKEVAELKFGRTPSTMQAHVHQMEL